MVELNRARLRWMMGSCLGVAVAVAGCGGGGNASPSDGGGGSPGGGAGGPTGSGGSGGGAGGANAAPPLTSGEDQPTNIAVDDTYLYWTTATAVRRMAKTGGAPTTLFGSQDSPDEVAVDATNVYWLGKTSNRDVLRGPKAGGQATMLATGASGGLVIDDGFAYWTARGTSSGVLLRVAKTGGTPEMLSSASNFGALALDDAYVYWAEGFMGRVQRIAKTGGQIMDLQPADPSNANLIALDALNVYFTTSTDLAQSAVLRRVVKTGATTGGAATSLASGLDHAVAIAVAGDAVYWITAGDTGPAGYLDKIPAVGGTPVPLASVVGYPGGMAVDAQYVYWTEVGDFGFRNGRVRRIAR